jgi:hypothetical protein
MLRPAVVADRSARGKAAVTRHQAVPACVGRGLVAESDAMSSIDADPRNDIGAIRAMVEHHEVTI